MLTLAILAAGLSIIWTAFAVFANMMASPGRPGAPFVGALSLWVCWLVTAGLFVWWMIVSSQALD
jgi:hypothetical protein